MASTVSELSKKLLEFDFDLKVEMCFDTGSFSPIEGIWLDDEGSVILSEDPGNLFSSSGTCVSDVIKTLSTLPQEAPVKINFDLGAFRDISEIFLGTTVVLCE
jgi:hypothetical protein